MVLLSGKPSNDKKHCYTFKRFNVISHRNEIEASLTKFTSNTIESVQ